MSNDWDKYREQMDSILDPYIGQEVTDTHVLESLLTDIIEKVSGLVIVDFLDLTNWDSIESVNIDHENRILTLVWHDYRSKNESEEERIMRQMVFPASLYSLMLHFQSFRVEEVRASLVVLFRGFALEDKEINRQLQPGTQDYQVFKYNAFSQQVVRKLKGTFECIDVITSHLYTVSIVSKQVGLSVLISKLNLLNANFALLRRRLDCVDSDLSSISDTDHDRLNEKANTVRRITEYLLKLYATELNIEFSKPYNRLLLGDLIGGMKTAFPLCQYSCRPLRRQLYEVFQEFQELNS